MPALQRLCAELWQQNCLRSAAGYKRIQSIKARTTVSADQQQSSRQPRQVPAAACSGLPADRSHTAGRRRPLHDMPMPSCMHIDAQLECTSRLAGVSTAVQSACSQLSSRPATSSSRPAAPGPRVTDDAACVTLPSEWVCRRRLTLACSRRHRCSTWQQVGHQCAEQAGCIAASAPCAAGQDPHQLHSYQQQHAD